MDLRISKFLINARKSAVQWLLITSWILTGLEVFLHPTPLSRVDQSRASCDQKKENTGTHCKDQRDRLPIPQDSLLGSSCAPWIRRLVRYLEFVELTFHSLMNKLQIHRVYRNMWDPFQEWTESIKTMNILPIWSSLKFITLYYSIMHLEFLKDYETLIGQLQACVQTEASHFKGLLRR